MWLVIRVLRFTIHGRMFLFGLFCMIWIPRWHPLQPLICARVRCVCAPVCQRSMLCNSGDCSAIWVEVFGGKWTAYLNKNRPTQLRIMQTYSICMGQLRKHTDPFCLLSLSVRSNMLALPLWIRNSEYKIQITQMPNAKSECRRRATQSSSVLFCSVQLVTAWENAANEILSD